MRRKNVSAPVAHSQLDRIEQEIRRRDADILAGSFRKFVEQAWPIVEPGVQFLPGYHIDAICEHLQACSDRHIRRLLINVPPRHTKSTLCSVLYPAWLWTHSQNESLLFASYSLQLATRDAVKMRRVVESEWFQHRWPLKMMDDSNLKTAFVNEKLGTRQTTSVSGTVTGLGGRHLIVDDGHNIRDAESNVVRQNAVQWYRESWYSRANTKDTVMITIGQRVHCDDISNYCLQEGGWEHLNLPMLYEGKKTVTSLGWSDPREVFGEVLWPQRYDQSEADSLKRTLGSYGFASQYQQNPVPRGGGVIKKEWLRFWWDPKLGDEPDPVRGVNDNGEPTSLIQKSIFGLERSQPTASWDLAFRGGENNDYVVGQVWVRGGHRDTANFYLLDQSRGHFDFPATKAAMMALYAAYPGTVETLVEEKANGAAAIAELKNHIPALKAVLPLGGKESRAAAVAALFEAGNVYLPHPAQHPWVDEYIEELTTFPRGAYDDQVDCTTQCLAHLRQRTPDVVDLSLGSGVGSEYAEWLIPRESHWSN